MAAEIDTGMPKGKMKQLLTRSKHEPVTCAIGLGDNPQLGLLMLSTTKSGIGCQQLLVGSFPHAKNLRWGKAFVDVDENPKLVKFSLNKGVTGMGRKLANSLKGTGFNKVVIVFEDGSAGESIDDEATDDAQAATSAPAQAATEDLAAAAAAPAPPPPPPPLAQPSPEERAAAVAALVKRLAALAPGIPAAAGDDAGRRAVLLKMAGEANVNIKTGNLANATKALDQLEAELTATATPGQTTTEVFATSRTAWAGARQGIETDIERLRAALAAAYAGQTVAAEVDTAFRTAVAPVLQTFDDRLLTLLDKMSAAPSPTETAPLISEARATMKSYLAFAMSNPLITDLDANPFVTLTIRNSVTTTLATLAKALH